MTAPFAHATLQRLKDSEAPGPGGERTLNVQAAGAAVAVQFNPTSLRLERQNNIDHGGVTATSQRVQQPAQKGATLAVDLEFDTAEEGTTKVPLDVRTRTALVRQFVEPGGVTPGTRDSGKPPPRVRFQWGTLIFVGLVEHLTEELDYFAVDGTPLRAKVSISITEQNLKIEENATGRGARDAKSSTPPGGGPAPGTLGSAGTKDVRQVVEAAAGDSVQDLLARLGADPAAWRSAMNGLTSPLALPAGTPVQLGPEATTAPGVGAASGFVAGTGISDPSDLAAVLARASATGAAAADAGLALAAGGGVAAATARVVGNETAATNGAERGSFAVPAVASVPADAGAAVSTVADAVDPRATTYGQAIPLRARALATTVAAIAAEGRRALLARARTDEVPTSDAPGQAPWALLPPEGDERQ